MNTFELAAPDGTHLGFWLMLDDEETDGKSGQFALKLNETGKTFTVLRDLQNDERALFWIMAHDEIELFDDDDVFLGTLKQGYLNLSHQHFLLTDLTGNG